jgi:large subunit ribosomal protein L17
MRHRKDKKTLDRGSAHRNALVRNLAKSLLLHEKIRTTETKAKFVKPFAEKIITLGKTNTLATRRRIISILGSNAIAQKILQDISPRYKERAGGYTRIIKIGQRRGDGAPMVFLTLV